MTKVKYENDIVSSTRMTKVKYENDIVSSTE